MEEESNWRGVNLLRNLAILSSYAILVFIMVMMMLGIQGWITWFLVFLGFYCFGFMALWQYDKNRTIVAHSGELQLDGPIDQDFDKQEPCELSIEAIDEFPSIPQNIQSSVVKFVKAVRDEYNKKMSETINQRIDRLERLEQLTEEEREIYEIAEELATADKSSFNKQAEKTQSNTKKKEDEDNGKKAE